MYQRAVQADGHHSFAIVLIGGMIIASAISAQAARRSKVTIDSSVTIVESADEPAPVRRATDDLLNDFAKVLGQTPSLANHMEGSGQVAILISGPTRPYAGIKCAEPTGGAESFAFSVVHLAGGPVRDVICLAGADMRGTIYAIYQFSQRCWAWTRCICGPTRSRRSALRSCCRRILRRSFLSPVFQVSRVLSE